MNSLKPFSIPCLQPKEELLILGNKTAEKHREPASDYSKPSKRNKKSCCSSSSTESSSTSHVLSHSSNKPVLRSSVASASGSFSTAETNDDMRTVRTTTPAQCNALEPSPFKIKLKRTLKEDGTYNYRIDASHLDVKPTPPVPRPPPCPVSVSYPSLSHEVINSSGQTVVTHSRQQFEHSPLVPHSSHSLTEIENNKQLLAGDRLSRKRTSSSIERPMNFKRFDVSMPKINHDYIHSTPLYSIRNRPIGQTTPIMSRPLNLYNGRFTPMMSHLLNQRNEAATPVASRPLDTLEEPTMPITSRPLDLSSVAKNRSMKNDMADINVSVCRPPPSGHRDYLQPTLNGKEATKADSVSLRSKESSVYSYTNGYNICHRSLSSISTSNGRTTITSTSTTVSTRTSIITNKPSCLAEEGVASTVINGSSIKGFTSHYRDAVKHHDIAKLSKPLGTTTSRGETRNDCKLSNSIHNSSKQLLRNTEGISKETNCETKPSIEGGIPLESNQDCVVPKQSKPPSQEIPMETNHVRNTVPKSSKPLLIATEGVLKETRHDREPNDDSIPKLSQLASEGVQLETNYRCKRNNGIPTSSQLPPTRPRVPLVTKCKSSSTPTSFQPLTARFSPRRVPLETNCEPSSTLPSSQPLTAKPRVPLETNNKPSSIPASSQPPTERPRVPLTAKRKSNSTLPSSQPPTARPRVPLETNNKPSSIPASSQPPTERPRVPLAAKHKSSSTSSPQPPTARPRVPLETNCEPSNISTSPQPLAARARIPMETNRKTSSIRKSQPSTARDAESLSSPPSSQPPTERPRVPLETDCKSSNIHTSSQSPTSRHRVPPLEAKLHTNCKPGSIPISSQPPTTKPMVPLLETNHKPSSTPTSPQLSTARSRVPLETNHEPSSTPTSPQPPQTAEGVLKETSSNGCKSNSSPKSSKPPSEGVLPVASTTEQSKPAGNSNTEADDDDSVIVINIDSPLSIIDSLNSSSTSEPAPPQSNPAPPQTLQELSSNPSYMSDSPDPAIESNPSQPLSDKKYQAILRDWQDKLNQRKKESDALIFVENNIDKVLPPFGFNYISESIYSKGVPRPDPMALVGCTCTSCNDFSMCCPRMAGHRFGYFKNGKLKVGVRMPIYECNRMCHCGSDCNNRIVQKGSQYPLCIFRTSNGCGWGVKTCCPIEKGKFIAEYVGELITFEEAEKRGKQYDREGSTYLFDLDFNDSAEFTIDATHNGNVSHFFNHSCDPNLVVFSVWIDTLDLRLPRLGLFALKDIGKGEELTFDYQMNHNMTSVDADKRIPCLCGSKKCRKFLF